MNIQSYRPNLPVPDFRQADAGQPGKAISPHEDYTGSSVPTKDTTHSKMMTAVRTVGGAAAGVGLGVLISAATPVAVAVAASMGMVGMGMGAFSAVNLVRKENAVNSSEFGAMFFGALGGGIAGFAAAASLPTLAPALMLGMCGAKAGSITP